MYFGATLDVLCAQFLMGYSANLSIIFFVTDPHDTFFLLTDALLLKPSIPQGKYVWAQKIFFFFLTYVLSE